MMRCQMSAEARAAESAQAEKAAALARSLAAVDAESRAAVAKLAVPPPADLSQHLRCKRGTVHIQ